MPRGQIAAREPLSGTGAAGRGGGASAPARAPAAAAVGTPIFTALRPVR